MRLFMERRGLNEPAFASRYPDVEVASLHVTMM
jgi:hypothetical protein